MTDDEKTAESAAGLIPEPGERREPIEQIRQMHAEVHSVHPADPAECNCSKCALLAEIDRLQAQLGAVVEECLDHRWIGEGNADADDLRMCSCGHEYNGEGPVDAILQWENHIRSLHPSATKALARRVLEEAKWWAAYCVFLAPDPEKHPTHHPVSEIVHMKDCNCEWHKRIAALEAALKRAGTSSRP